MKTIAALLPALGPGSGGLRTVLHLLGGLARRGCQCHVYVEGNAAEQELKENLRKYYECDWVIPHAGLNPAPDHDLVLATMWHTALALTARRGSFKRAYLVQDYEPFFYPMGAHHLLAEFSYEQPLQIITMGRWLARKLNTEFGLTCRSLDFCADTNLYRPRLEGTAAEFAIAAIFQPDKPRRAPLICLQALQQLQAVLPHLKIYTFGSPHAPLNLKCNHLGIIPPARLSSIYSQCLAGLCVSMTNPSRLPFEMLAAGLPVVEAHRDNNFYDLPPEGVLLAELKPESIKEALLDLVANANLRETHRQAGLKFMADRPARLEQDQFCEHIFDILAERRAKKPVATAVTREPYRRQAPGLTTLAPASEPYDLLTVDVWDTLLRRRCHPDEIKLFTAHYLQLTHWSQLKPACAGTLRLFQERVHCEAAIGQQKRAQGWDDEYPIKEVFIAWLGAVLATPPARPELEQLADELVAVEVAQEQRCIYADGDVRALLARIPARRRLFLSDFYMPAARLRALLRHAGLEEVVSDGLVSCDVSLNKRSGRLFQKIERDCQVAPARHIHVGDNEYADYQVPQSLGITGVPFQNPAESQRCARLKLEFLQRTTPRTQIPATSNSRNKAEQPKPIQLEPSFCPAELLEWTQLCNEDLEQLETAEAMRRYGQIMAPLFAGFALFVAEEALKAGLPKLHFCTREGEFFAEVYSALARSNPFGVQFPEPVIIEVSRLSTFAASINRVDLSEFMRIWNMYSTQTLHSLFLSLDFEPLGLEPLLQAHGLKLDETLQHPWRDPRVQKLFAASQFVQALSQRAAEKRGLLLEYLQKKGIRSDQSKLGLVDIGWRGTIHDNLAWVLPRTTLHGWYFGLLPFLNVQPPNATKHSFGPGRTGDRPQLLRLLDFVSPLEMLSNSAGGSTIRYERRNGSVSALREVNPSEQAVFDQFTRHFQAGVLSQIPRVAELVRHRALTTEELRPFCLDLLARLVHDPPRVVAQAYFSLNHNETFGTGAFDDKRRHQSRLQEASSLYYRGELEKFETELRATTWPQGFSRLCGIEYPFFGRDNSQPRELSLQRRRQASKASAEAIGFYRQSQWDKALQAARIALALDPWRLRLHYLVYRACFELRRPKEAVEQFRLIGLLHPAHAPSFHEFALRSFESGLKARGLSLFEEIVENRPDYLPATLNLCRLHLRQNQPLKALAILGQAISEFGDDPEFLRFRAQAQLFGGRSLLTEGCSLLDRLPVAWQQELPAAQQMRAELREANVLDSGDNNLALALEEFTTLRPDDHHLGIQRSVLAEPVQSDSASPTIVTSRVSHSRFTVGFLCAEPEDYACPFLRLKSPLQHLHKTGKLDLLSLCEVRGQRLELKQSDLNRADLIVVQRQMAALLPYSELRKRLNGHSAKIVFELDDALTHLPQEHRAWANLQKCRPHFEEYLRKADLVTVSTPALKSLYQELNPNIIVLPNSVDLAVWSPLRSAAVDAEKITILFSGTLDHERDLRVVEDALLDLFAAYPDRVQLLYWGNITEKLRGMPQVKSVHEFQPNYHEYARLLRDLPASFALVPLEDIPFNRAKSPIKWLEYSLCRIPGIYSDLAPYNQVVENRATGLLVANTREAWLAAMKSLVEEHSLREALAQKAQAAVLARHTVEHNAALWLEAYSSLLQPKAQPATPIAAPLVSIVIPTYNRSELTRKCLEALRTHTPAADYEVIVVDNGSTDATPAFLKEQAAAGQLRAILNAKNLGFSKACNQGAAEAKGEFVLFLNNDTEVTPGWLEALTRSAQADPRIGAVGPKLVFPNSTIQHAGVVLVNSGQDPLLARHVYHGAPHDLPEANRPTTYQALTAACLVVPRDLFNQVGGFDEEYWNGYEDVDLCLKIGQAGRLLLYQPQSLVVHHESQSGPERFRKAPQNIARLHAKWLKKVTPDYLVGADGQVSKTEAARINAYVAPAAQNQPPSGLSSIIILAYNQLQHTRLCLESIAAHTCLPHEVILVDNGSTDGTPEFFETWQRAHPNCIVIRNAGNRGFAAGNNQALALARGHHLVLLNNDTVVTERWLEGLLKVFQLHPQTGIVGPVSNNVSGPQQVQPAQYKDLSSMPAFAAAWRQQHLGKSVEVNRAVGFCLLMSRAVLEQIGGLDEQFGSGNFEDDDLCIRARLAGFGVRIAQEVFIHHTGSQTFKGARIDYRQAMLRNWDLFRKKWQLSPDSSLERGYHFPKSLPAGLELKVTLPNLSLSHQQAGENRWVESTPASKPTPARAEVKLPAVAALGSLTEARSLFQKGDLALAWDAGVEALTTRPFHPQAALLLAELASAAGDGQSARQCAQYARGLAPDWKAPKQFLQKSPKAKERPAWLKLPACIVDAKHPAKTGPRLTVCLITKNEERFLAQCLESVKNLATQIVVVDTGSTDRTVEIAKSFRAEVFHFDWSDDFAAARNAALEHARGDWVLILDADEELPSDQHARLIADLKNQNAIALRLPLVNRGQEAEGRSYVPRLFRNAPGVYYSGRIHEQVFPSLIPVGKPLGLGTGLGTAQILHHGYSQQMVKDRNKIQRNLKLLRLAIEESPEDANLAMNLGLELVRSEELIDGLAQYRRAFQLMTAKPAEEIVPELCEALLTQFTSHLYKTRAHQEVVEVLTSSLARKTGLTASLHFALGLACYELGRYPEAVEQMRQCLAKRQQSALTPINTDILTAAPHHCLAMSLARAGDVVAAEKAFQAGLNEKGRREELRLDYARFLVQQNRHVDALHRLHELVAEQGDCAAAWRLGAQIALSRPDFLEFACDWTSEALKQLPNDNEIAAQRAEALLLSQQTGQARELWRTVCQKDPQPRSHAALLLCEVVEEGDLSGLEPNEAELGPTNRALLDWYQRCLAMRAQNVLDRLNQRLDHLGTLLPAAAGLIEAALADAGAESNVSEPCLA